MANGVGAGGNGGGTGQDISQSTHEQAGVLSYKDISRIAFSQ